MFYLKILLLGPYKENIVRFLKSYSDTVEYQEAKIEESQIKKEDWDYIISYGYRFLIPKSVVDHYARKIINLHISLLPWNRGADPNLWSFLEDTPKGVTIHYIDEGLDTGDIIAQQKVIFSEEETLTTTYQKLIEEIEILFKKVWPNIREGKNHQIIQTGKGSYHNSKDKDKYMHFLHDGWNTPIKSIIKSLK